MTGDDEDNIIASLLARRLGVYKVVALINRPELPAARAAPRREHHRQPAPRRGRPRPAVRAEGTRPLGDDVPRGGGRGDRAVGHRGSRFVGRPLRDAGFPARRHRRRDRPPDGRGRRAARATSRSGPATASSSSPSRASSTSSSRRSSRTAGGAAVIRPPRSATPSARSSWRSPASCASRWPGACSSRPGAWPLAGSTACSARGRRRAPGASAAPARGTSSRARRPCSSSCSPGSRCPSSGACPSTSRPTSRRSPMPTSSRCLGLHDDRGHGPRRCGGAGAGRSSSGAASPTGSAAWGSSCSGSRSCRWSGTAAWTCTAPSSRARARSGCAADRRDRERALASIYIALTVAQFVALRWAGLRLRLALPHVRDARHRRVLDADGQRRGVREPRGRVDHHPLHGPGRHGLVQHYPPLVERKPREFFADYEIRAYLIDPRRGDSVVIARYLMVRLGVRASSARSARPRSRWSSIMTTTGLRQRRTSSAGSRCRR